MCQVRENKAEMCHQLKQCMEGGGDAGFGAVGDTGVGGMGLPIVYYSGGNVQTPGTKVYVNEQHV